MARLVYGSVVVKDLRLKDKDKDLMSKDEDKVEPQAVAVSPYG